MDKEILKLILELGIGLAALIAGGIVINNKNKKNKTITNQKNITAGGDVAGRDIHKK